MRYWIVAIVCLLALGDSGVDSPAQAQDGDGSEEYSKGEQARMYGNYHVMLDWFRKSAAKGHGKASNMMGLLYLRGELVGKKDPLLAVSFFETAASKGEAIAHGNLGHMNERGMGIPVNVTAAIGHFRRGVAGGAGQFSVHLARLLLDADRSLEEQQEGVVLVQQAAATNSPTGIYLLGTLYEKGGPGFEANASEAVTLFKKAMEMQHIPAISKMAQLHHTGALSPVPHDEGAARRLAERAAYQGDSDAMALLGFLCGAGLGGSQDISASVLWTKRAANAEHALAKANFAIMRREGFGMTAEPQE